jgi:hypothetical protein
MIVALIILLSLLGPLAYFLGADSRVMDERDARPWI